MPYDTPVATARDGRRCAWAAGLLVPLLLSPLPALATTVRHVGLKEIVAASDTIAQGRVESVRSFWREKQIVTEVSVVVSRGLKGGRTDHHTFLQAGGRVEKREVVGPPPFE